jgi:hypothetical protein
MLTHGMILNAFAILSAAVALLSLAVGLLVVGLGIGSLRRSRHTTPEERKTLEDRNYLLSLLALLLVGLNAVSWPLLYLLLQSYVPEWPGAMCIYGVTQVGAGSVGASRFLPGLLVALQALKPLEVFAGGAWFVLYLVNRSTATGALLGRLFVVLTICGVLAVADAGLELAYLAIPKKEEVLSTGCCTAAVAATSGTWTTLTEAAGGGDGLRMAYYLTNLAMLTALAGWVRQSAAVPPRSWLVVLAALASVTLAAAAGFLVEVGAPTVLHLPYHHCPYDLIPAAPDVVIGAALFLGGTFAVGWAAVVGWCGGSSARPIIGRLLFLGFCGYLGSLVLMSVELALA